MHESIRQSRRSMSQAKVLQPTGHENSKAEVKNCLVDLDSLQPETAEAVAHARPNLSRNG